MGIQYRLDVLDLLSVNYIDLIPVLIKSFQERSIITKGLKASVDSLLIKTMKQRKELVLREEEHDEMQEKMYELENQITELRELVQTLLEKKSNS